MRTVFLILGFCSIALGIIGIFLPILPTTPFAIMAAYCFSKSSPKMQQWVYDMPKIGGMVKEWDDHGVISKKAKFTSLLVLWPVTIFGVLQINSNLLLRFIPILIGLMVSFFILTRPSER